MEQEEGKSVKDFWNSRAALKERAGTDDLIAKWLEMRVLTALCSVNTRGKKSPSVLDVGCGNGMTLINVAKATGAYAVGTDSAVEMVKAARAAWKAERGDCEGLVDFQVNDVLTMQRHDFPSKFDVAYTERTLINLPTLDKQVLAVRNILACVKKGGAYLMLENSADGLLQINQWRQAVGLPEIKAPWHNRYLHDDEWNGLVIKLKVDKVAELESVSYYSSTYYFLSRVVNAMLAAKAGEEPDYLSDVNRLALDLPTLPGFLGQGRLWVWRRL